MEPFTFITVIFLATLLFEFGNGFNDAANSIATIVSTRVLPPRLAVAWAAFWNLVAAFVFGTAVAKTMGQGLVHLDRVDEWVLLGGLLGAIVWTYVCTHLGLPISVSHSLMGGYGGAAVAKAGWQAIVWSGWKLPLLFIFLSPLLGMLMAMILVLATSWTVRHQAPWTVDRWFRQLQLVSAAAYSLGHGTNDAQKGMGIITAALVTAGALPNYEVPFWVVLSCHAAIAAGTMAGGWRVVKTMGQRITKLRPFDGFSAETAGALLLIGTAQAGIPVSTTHTITGAIIGVGATHRITAVRWGIARRIIWAWVLTIPGAALIAALSYLLLNWLH
ncbi:MAG: inorganic phosphate transporter [Firmicutes bacterium]|nr:inorganic phosphate transporter [Bacillota bacterium]